MRRTHAGAARGRHIAPGPVGGNGALARSRGCKIGDRLLLFMMVCPRRVWCRFHMSGNRPPGAIVGVTTVRVLWSYGLAERSPLLIRRMNQPAKEVEPCFVPPCCRSGTRFSFSHGGGIASPAIGIYAVTAKRPWDRYASAWNQHGFLPPAAFWVAWQCVPPHRAKIARCGRQCKNETCRFELGMPPPGLWR